MASSTAWVPLRIAYPAPSLVYYIKELIFHEDFGRNKKKTSRTGLFLSTDTLNVPPNWRRTNYPLRRYPLTSGPLAGSLGCPPLAKDIQPLKGTGFPPVLTLSTIENRLSKTIVAE